MKGVYFRRLSLLLTLALLLGLLPTLRLTADAANVTINTTNFPDDKFRAYVTAYIDTDKNGVLSDAERNVKTIDCSVRNIASLKGVEYFTALTNLDCSRNQISALDLSKNTALKELNCSENALTSLSFSKNTALTKVRCFSNQLTALDVSKNAALQTLACQTNQLTALNLSANPALLSLDCSRNQLTALNVSGNTKLTELRIDSNQLTSVQLQSNPALTGLYCTNNKLTALDVSKNTKLTHLYCGGNQITALDVRSNPALIQLICYSNRISKLDVSRCPNLTYLDCQGSSLTELELGRQEHLEALYCYSSNLSRVVLTGAPLLCDAVLNGEKTFNGETRVTYRLGTNVLEIYYRTEPVTYRTYDLKIRGVAVTDLNRNDILGDGVFAFDGVQTLTIKGNCSAGADVTNLIENEWIRGLRIKVLSDSKLTTAGSNVILCRADTVITGPGKLTLKTTNSYGCGIYVYTSDTTLILEEADVAVDAVYGIAGPNGENNAWLVATHATVNSTASEGAVTDFGGGIALRETGIYFPTNGKVKDGSIVNIAGHVADSVILMPLQRTNPFVDVKTSDAYYDAVLWAYYHYPGQVTNGTDATHFSPGKTVTRGQAVRFLWNAVGQPEPANTKNPFTDNKSGKFYYEAVLWAYYNDPQITNGTSATLFSPNRTCSRAQILTFLWKAVGQPEPTISNPYSDVPAGKYYTKAAIWAYENGLEKGENGKFNYNKDCTRAAIVLYMYRFYTGKDLVK